MSAATGTIPAKDDKREIFGWTMYDWANSAFSTTVGTVFLGPYVTSIAEQAADANGFLQLGSFSARPDSLFAYAVSASVLLQVAFLPILGALADYSHMRKKLLMFFATVGAIATMLMFFITDGGHWFAGGLFIIANVSFGAAVVFYNAYLPDIASEDRRDHVSASGFAMGYAGGGLLLLLNLIMFMFSDQLGLSGSMVARISLASAGVWWLGFSLITFRLLRSRHSVKPLPPNETYLTIGFSQLAVLLGVSRRLVVGLMLLPLLIPILILFQFPLWVALIPGGGPIAILVIFISRKAKTMPEAMKYMVAYLLYNDGIQTVIAVAAIFAAEELGISEARTYSATLLQRWAPSARLLSAWLSGARRSFLRTLG
jgi:UMF1 family MFS transporter